MKSNKTMFCCDLDQHHRSRSWVPNAKSLKECAMVKPQWLWLMTRATFPHHPISSISFMTRPAECSCQGHAPAAAKALGPYITTMICRILGQSVGITCHVGTPRRTLKLHGHTVTSLRESCNPILRLGSWHNFGLPTFQLHGGTRFFDQSEEKRAT